MLRAFDAVEVSGGELDLTVPQGSGTPDPCALPEADGYTGEDNRLYRIEVHEGGSLDAGTPEVVARQRQRAVPGHARQHR